MLFFEQQPLAVYIYRDIGLARKGQRSEQNTREPLLLAVYIHISGVPFIPQQKQYSFYSVKANEDDAKETKNAFGLFLEG